MLVLQIRNRLPRVPEVNSKAVACNHSVAEGRFYGEVHRKAYCVADCNFVSPAVQAAVGCLETNSRASRDIPSNRGADLVRRAGSIGDVIVYYFCVGIPEIHSAVGCRRPW